MLFNKVHPLSQIPPHKRTPRHRSGFFNAFVREIATGLSLSPRTISFIRRFYLGEKFNREQITSLAYSYSLLKKEDGRKKPKWLYQQAFGLCLNASDKDWNVITMKTKWDLPKNELQKLYATYNKEDAPLKNKPQRGVNALGF
jgi:hypothetical protein